MTDQKILKVANLAVVEVVHLKKGNGEEEEVNRAYLLAGGSLAFASKGWLEETFDFLGEYEEVDDPLGCHCRVVPPGKTVASLMKFRKDPEPVSIPLAA